MKLKSKIVLAFAVLSAAAVYYLIDWVVRDLKPRFRETVEESLIDAAEILAALTAQHSQDAAAASLPLRRAMAAAKHRALQARIYDYVKFGVDMRIQIADAAGVVVYDSYDPGNEGRDFSRWNNIVRALRGEYGARTTRDIADDPTTTVMYVSAPIISGNKLLGVLTVGKPGRSIGLLVDRAQQRLWLAGFLCLAGALILAALLSHWISLPLGRLTRYARAVQQGANPALPPLGGGEIRLLGEAFFDMKNALEGRQYVEQYVHTLTHELKSPLAAIYGAAELLAENPEAADRERFTSNILRETARIRRLIDLLLELSGLERMPHAARAPFDAVELLQSVKHNLEPEADNKQVRVIIKSGPAVRAEGDRRLLELALANLARNALEFSPAGGEVTLSVARSQQGVVFSAADEGPGIPAYAKEKIFDRFYSLPRPDTKQKSSGLGLSIAKQIAELHHGTLSVENQAAGGVQAVLTIP